MFEEYESSTVIRCISNDGLVDYYPQFLNQAQSDSLLHELQFLDNFTQNEISLFGKRIKVPRMEAYFALNGEKYGYSGQQLQPKIFPAFLNELRLRVELLTGQTYNALLINWYRNGQDSNGWHSDDERELGINPSIASISLGAERIFELKHLKTGQKSKLLLSHGSLLHMHGTLQHHYKHQLPKKNGLLKPRFNLTFRKIQPSS